MLNKFESDNIAAKVIQKICCSKCEGTVDHKMVQEISFRLQEARRSGKIM